MTKSTYFVTPGVAPTVQALHLFKLFMMLRTREIVKKIFRCHLKVNQILIINGKLRPSLPYSSPRWKRIMGDKGRVFSISFRPRKLWRDTYFAESHTVLQPKVTNNQLL